MGKPKPPRPADPKVTAGAQTATNIGTAIAQQNLNNVNQVTPFGNLTYNQSGSHTYTDPNTGQQHVIPTYTATQTLSPEQQAILDQNNQSSLNLSKLATSQSEKLNSLLNKPVTLDNLPDAGSVEDIRKTQLQRFSGGPHLQTSYNADFSKDRQRVEDALMERMRPSQERDRERLESRLASQGIRMGSEAYQSAMDDYGRQTNDARLGAILAGGQEQSRLAGLEAQHAAFGNQARQTMFGNEMRGISMNNKATLAEANADAMRFDAANSARNQALQEQYRIRNQPINEITALMSGSQVKNPNFITPKVAQMATTDFAGIQANYDNAMQQRYQQQMANWNGLMGGILGFGSNILTAGAGSPAAMMFSDKRLKTDIKKVGKTNDGQQIYSYRYKSGGPIQMGLMAQEVEKKKPQAVADIGGFKMVDYGIALGRVR